MNPVRGIEFDDSELRAELVATTLAMSAARLNTGASGNASVRTPGGMLITPSGLAPDACTPDDMVVVDPSGRPDGRLAPSSEWRLHNDLYAHRPEAGAIIHAHAPFATALACQRLEIPPFHYMIARFGGNNVRCAKYATFGTQALSDHIATAIADRSACLMANHGMLVFGRNLANALALAIEFETLCEQYWRVRQLGKPVLLSDDEMREVVERFRWYGKPAEQLPE
ncbi:MAG: class II aldolase/adducin family protein [Aromatoleum sp.]|jgi:L-fuculose-phosphate aldolase|uniref:class II aldolase/adducin family protein n=1 Tax=Aromatoleum sp. TaxID=2307007 RepID=UPI002893B995|nr:class II aldolase/adducin family protein [Aromatoleum sp.]MDT3672014.1 class II aldolase/adducin family protein [Aromatoleum sp.]